MSLSPQDQHRIVEQESAWTDNAFGQPDLSAFPALNELPPDNKHDDRFARDWRDTPFSASTDALRNFVSDPDLDAMVESGSGDLLRDVRDRRAEEVVREFKRRVPDYLPTDSNFDDMLRTLRFNAFGVDHYDDADAMIDRLMQAGYWTVDNLTRVYEGLDREGILQVPAGQARHHSRRSTCFVPYVPERCAFARASAALQHKPWPNRIGRLSVWRAQPPKVLPRNSFRPIWRTRMKLPLSQASWRLAAMCWELSIMSVSPNTKPSTPCSEQSHRAVINLVGDIVEHAEVRQPEKLVQNLPCNSLLRFGCRTFWVYAMKDRSKTRLTSVSNSLDLDMSLFSTFRTRAGPRASNQILLHAADAWHIPLLFRFPCRSGSQVGLVVNERASSDVKDLAFIRTDDHHLRGHMT